MVFILILLILIYLEEKIKVIFKMIFFKVIELKDIVMNRKILNF